MRTAHIDPLASATHLNPNQPLEEPLRKTLALAALTAAAMSTTASAAPSVDDVLNAYKTASGGTALAGKAVLDQTADYAGNGLTGSAHMLTDLKSGRFAEEFKIGPATGGDGFDGTNAWSKDTSGTVTLQQGGDQRAIAVSNAYRNANLWWQPDHGGAAITASQKTDNGVAYDVLHVVPKGGNPFDAWFDPKSHELVRTVEKQSSQTVTSTMSDFKAFDGVMLPAKTVEDDGLGEKYLQTVTLTSAAFKPALPDSAYAAPKVEVADFSIAAGAKEATFPITLINNHIYGQASVDGKGPYTFVFDTGGHNLVDPALAAQLDLKVEGDLPGTGAGNGVMKTGLTHVDSLSVGDATVKNQLFMVLPLNELSPAEGHPMPAMVGYETFRRFVTRIDYGAHTMTLIDPKTFDPKDAGTAIPFTFNGSDPEVMGTFEGLPAKFDIDTGSRAELTLTKPFAENNDLRAKHPKGVETVDGWGVGGPSHGYVTMGKDMTLGSVDVGPVVTSLSTDAKGAFAGNDYQGNVGGGILKRFVVTFDYDRQMMYLKKLPGPVADTGTFDRSGMWINDSDKGFQVVDVTKDGPADTAGLKVNDVITAVDGKPVTSLHLYDLRRELRDEKPGTVVHLSVLRDAETKDIAVTLKNQI